MIILLSIGKHNSHNASANSKTSAAPKEEMRISTKFEIGDFVYVMHDNDIHTGKIVRIDCSSQHNGNTQQQTIIYTLELPDI